MPTRKPYPTDVSDQEWAFVAPYLALVREDAPQRVHNLREVFDALGWIVERSFAWASRFRRLARDYELLPTILVGCHFVTFASLFLRRASPCSGQSLTASTRRLGPSFGSSTLPRRWGKGR